MSLSISNTSLTTNGEWKIECTIDFPDDRERVKDLFKVINPVLTVPHCPIEIPFVLFYHPIYNLLTMTLKSKLDEDE